MHSNYLVPVFARGTHNNRPLTRFIKDPRKDMELFTYFALLTYK